MSDKITLTIQYWDCECESNYIRPRSEIKCEICGAMQEDQPPARLDEVLAAGFQVTAPIYCTQNGGDCESCSLSNYGRDCMNNKIQRKAEAAP